MRLARPAQGQAGVTGQWHQPGVHHGSACGGLPTRWPRCWLAEHQVIFVDRIGTIRRCLVFLYRLFVCCANDLCSSNAVCPPRLPAVFSLSPPHGGACFGAEPLCLSSLSPTLSQGSLQTHCCLVWLSIFPRATRAILLRTRSVDLSAHSVSSLSISISPTAKKQTAKQTAPGCFAFFFFFAPPCLASPGLAWPGLCLASCVRSVVRKRPLLSLAGTHMEGREPACLYTPAGVRSKALSNRFIFMVFDD